jgi:hypothetical protein
MKSINDNHKNLKEWLKKWGNFASDAQVETYPFCLVDVMSIMAEYSAEKEKQMANLIRGALTSDPVVDKYKLKQYFTDHLTPALREYEKRTTGVRGQSG